NALAALAEENRFGAFHVLKILRPQQDVAGRAAAVHHLRHSDSAASLAHALILLVGGRWNLLGDAGPLGLQLGRRLLIHCRPLPGYRLLGFHLRLLFLERQFRRFYVLLQRLGFPHHFQNAVFQPADFLLAELDLVLEGAILIVGLGADHLILELGDLLLLHRDIGFALLALFLIGRQRGAVGIELAVVRDQFLLNFRDVFGQGGDLAREFGQTIIDFLQADHQLQVEEHYLWQCNTPTPSAAVPPAGRSPGSAPGWRTSCPANAPTPSPPPHPSAALPPGPRETRPPRRGCPGRATPIPAPWCGSAPPPPGSACASTACAPAGAPPPAGSAWSRWAAPRFPGATVPRRRAAASSPSCFAPRRSACRKTQAARPAEC